MGYNYRNRMMDRDMRKLKGHIADSERINFSNQWYSKCCGAYTPKNIYLFFILILKRRVNNGQLYCNRIS